MNLFTLNNKGAIIEEEEDQENERSSSSSSVRVSKKMFKGNNNAGASSSSSLSSWNNNATTTTNNNSSSSSSSSSKAIGDLLGSKLNKLSLAERSNGLYDLHGVSDLEEETAEMLQSRLEDMNRALETTPKGEDDDEEEPYNLAIAREPHYVWRLKLPCLRAENYNGTEAAKRLIRFFRWKLELFGEERLAKDITRDDLNKEEVEALDKGLIQLLPDRDRAGRAVLFANGPLNSLHSTKTVMRILYYMTMTALQDEDTQKKGIVGVYYSIGQTRVFADRPFAFMNSWRAMPWRVVALHSCANSSAIDQTAYLLCSVMDEAKVCRFRLHTGTYLECVYKLMTFGIPREAIPVSVDDGTISIENHTLMINALKMREQRHKQQQQNQQSPSSVSNQNNNNNKGVPVVVNIESSDDDNNNDDGSSSSINGTSSTTSTTPTLILVPNPMDILMGRGRHPKCRPGGLRMHSLLLEHRHLYDTATKIEKTVIAENILKVMKKSGCRFLTAVQNDGGGYVQCDDRTARKKISHGFRNLRLKDNENNNNNNTTTTAADGSDNQHYDQQGRKRNLS